MALIEEVGFYEKLCFTDLYKRNKYQLKEYSVTFARNFVDDHFNMLSRYRKIFYDFDEIRLEKLVGNIYLMDVDNHSFEETLSWCLIHYTTED